LERQTNCRPCVSRKQEREVQELKAELRAVRTQLTNITSFISAAQPGILHTEGMVAHALNGVRMLGGEKEDLVEDAADAGNVFDRV
jgi:hypothetical protein